MPKIKVDQEKCIGCGLCPEICSKSFKMEDTKAKPIKSEVSKITCEKEAADACPTDAIIIS